MRRQEEAEQARENKRQRKEEEDKNKSEWKSAPKSFAPEKLEVMSHGKRCKPNSAQRLIDLGPLLPIVAVAIPRMLPVTYLDLNSQLGAEQDRAKLLHLEEHARCMLQLAYCSEMLIFTAKFERLQRWTMLVEDCHLRLALQAGCQLFRAELHFREGIAQYEGLAWPHLTLHLFGMSERYHRR